MSRVLIIDKNVNFILKVQNMLPPDAEWVASVDRDCIQNLLQKQKFDFLLSRKNNLDILKSLLGSAVENQNSIFDFPFKKIIVLPNILWRGRLRHALGGGGIFSSSIFA